MAYKVELPPNIGTFVKKPEISSSLSLSKKTGESGDGGDVITEGRILAVEICSEVLRAHIWLAFDESFDPKDDQAVFYTHELPFLKDKSPEQLREIHKVKLAFGPGSWLRR